MEDKKCICEACIHFGVCKYSEELTEVNEHFYEMGLDFPDFIKMQLVCEKRQEKSAAPIMNLNPPFSPSYASITNSLIKDSCQNGLLKTELKQSCNNFAHVGPPF